MARMKDMDGTEDANSLLRKAADKLLIAHGGYADSRN